MAAPLPVVRPDDSIPKDVLVFFYAIKEVIDTLWDNSLSKKGFKNLALLPAQQMRVSSAIGAAVQITSGPKAADWNDHAVLVADVNQLARDVAIVSQKLDAVITRLKG